MASSKPLSLEDDRATLAAAAAVTVIEILSSDDDDENDIPLSRNSNAGTCCNNYDNSRQKTTISEVAVKRPLAQDNSDYLHSSVKKPKVPDSAELVFAQMMEKPTKSAEKSPSVKMSKIVAEVNKVGSSNCTAEEAKKLHEPSNDKEPAPVRSIEECQIKRQVEEQRPHSLVEEKSKHVENKKKQVGPVQGQLSSYSRDVEIKKREYRAIQRSIEQLSRQFEVKGEELESMQKLISECEKYLRLKQEQCSREVEMVLKVTSEHEEVCKRMKREIENYERDLEEKEAELTLMEDSVRECEQELKSHQIEFYRVLDDVDKDLERKDVELRALQKKIAECNKELKAKEEQFDAIRKLIDRQAGELQSEREKLMSIRRNQQAQVKKMDSMKKQFEEKTKELELKEEQFAEQMKELELREKHVEGRVKEVESKEKQFEGKVNKLQPNKKKYKGLVAKLKLEEEQLEYRVNELESKQKEFESKVEQLESTKKHFEGKLKELRSREKQLEGRAEEVESKERQFEGQANELESKVKRFEERERELESKEKLFEGQVEKLKSKEKQLKDRLKELAPKEKEVERQAMELQCKEKQFEVQLKELKSKQMQIEGEARDLESKKNQFERQLKDFEFEKEQHEALKESFQGEKKQDLLESLVKKKQHIEAVRFIHELKLAEKNQPIDLLREHVKQAKLICERSCKKNSIGIKVKAIDEEVASLGTVLQCISDNNLECQDLVQEIQDRLRELKGHKVLTYSGKDFNPIKIEDDERSSTNEESSDLGRPLKVYMVGHKKKHIQNVGENKKANLRERKTVRVDKSDLRDREPLLNKLYEYCTRKPTNVATKCKKGAAEVYLKNEEMISMCEHDLNRGDTRTMARGQWLNNHVITFASMILNEADKARSTRSRHCLSSYFMEEIVQSLPQYKNGLHQPWHSFPVLFPSCELGIATCNLIFAPAILEQHWWCYALNRQKMTLYILDSLEDEHSGDKADLDELVGIRFEELLTLLDPTLNRDDVLLRTQHVELPKQHNIDDCGIYVIKYMEMWDGVNEGGNTMPLWTAAEVANMRRDLLISWVMDARNQCRAQVLRAAKVDALLSAISPSVSL